MSLLWSCCLLLWWHFSIKQLFLNSIASNLQQIYSYIFLYPYPHILMLIVRNQIKQFFSYNIKSPINLHHFRQTPQIEQLKNSMKARFKNPSVVDQIAAKLQQHKTKLHGLEQINKEVNGISKQIKEKVKKEENAEELKEKIKLCKLNKDKEQTMLKQLNAQIQSLILQVGNIVDPNTPISQSENDNRIISTFHPSHPSNFNTSYQELCQKFSITDLPRGQKVSGHRGYYLKQNGLKLAMAIVQYGIEFLEKQGYSLFQAPAIISDQVLQQCCQLTTIQQDMYHLEGQKSYLIATSEQSLAGYYQNEVLMVTDLPVRMGGYSTCFRKEAGAHGKDIHGIFRVHQFEKIQQFTICEEQNSGEQMEKMLKISQKFYQSLGIPYQVVDVVSGELNDAASRKYDLEGWYPSQKKYRELVSISNCTDYQSRLLKVQYLKQKNLKYPHMLNGTLVAVQRAITCVLENYFRGDYIEVPKVLHSYMKRQKIQI